MTHGVRNPLRKIGRRFLNLQGDWATLLEDVDYKRVEVLFDSGTVLVTGFHHLLVGEFKDFMKPSVCGVGFVGSARTRNGHKIRNYYYERWVAIITRCYGTSEKKNKAYIDVTVSDAWLNFSNFYDWISEQKHGRNIRWNIDKDLFSDPLDKKYSEGTCVMLPTEINAAISVGMGAYSREPTCKSRGVRLIKPGDYKASLKIESGAINSKHFADECSAAMWYKDQKENYVKRLATKWKNELEGKAYDKLMAYELPINEEVL